MRATNKQEALMSLKRNHSFIIEQKLNKESACRQKLKFNKKNTPSLKFLLVLVF